MHTKTELLQLLRAHDLRLNKRLGQHYLIDAAVCRRLVELCQLTKQDRVIEIGAGLGALTDLLAEAAGEVLAVEVDRGMAPLLRSRLAHLANVRVICHDILAFPWSDEPGAKVVGAIPYHITSPILVELCQHAQEISEVWLGVQQEVADRLLAGPGTKAYGRLSLMLQYAYQAEQLGRIPRGACFPQPAVDSVWLHLIARARPAAAVKDETLFFEVIRAAFGQRRKTLLNCLSHLTSRPLTRVEASAVLKQAELPQNVRGETLSIEQFARVATLISEQFPSCPDDAKTTRRRASAR